jgi:hypothetical protein
MNFNNLNSYLVRGSKGFLYGYGVMASYFLLIHSSSIVQLLLGVAVGVTGWDWYKNRQK